ncbi:hydrogenase nickel insertion protein HypA [Methanocaldococcus villosus KIN24-T80]|uniref:Hydrogenase maturation factor HypA n=1 Tax=Methanocaldococcus villosus KIN24-T80 TaxID=1069083 RepID=N6VT17_9EURY|nr:hydrogenase maturation nickel metallochaperone HypA [Methanocaldococcus villosus]ENN96341.1 hydrogenase nickel insertion protein HypA [Methanocaldococcus villosus KIN24-T80]
MHELSLANSILDAILSAIESEEKKGRKVKKVKEIYLEIGELVFVNVEQLKFAFEVISEGTACEGAKVNIEILKSKCRCVNCGYEGEPKIVDDFIISCPKCGGFRLEIIGGKELNIKNVIIEYM